MTSEPDPRADRVFAIFEAVVELAVERRAAYLDDACAGDPELKAEVEALLAHDQSGWSLIERPAVEQAADLLADDDSPIGQDVGPFRVLTHLGAGGAGSVFLAEDSRLGRRVALKLLDRDLIGNRQSRTRFVREARLASALDHPNICTIHEIGEHSGRLFIAMQWVEGETLLQAIGGRPMPLERLLPIALQVAGALAAAHDQGIIHRDIKSSNIMVTPRGQAKVLDFGLARLIGQAADGEEDLTRRGAVMGTPAYMSPEQALGEPADHRSDIYSFGAVLYEMATGRTPSRKASQHETMQAVINQPHTPVSELNPSLPASLAAVIDRALSKRPADRYASAAELADGLRRVAAEAGIHTPLVDPSPAAGLPAAPRSAPRLWQRMRRAAVPAAVALLLLGGVAAVGYFARPAVTPSEPGPITSLAVLPFKPLIEAQRDQPLELGMADTLIARLSHLSEIVVRPLSAVHQYGGIGQDALAAGRAQRVDAVLDGRIQRAGDKLRVRVQLWHVADGRSLWAEDFDEQFTDLFSVQDSVASRVSTALAVTLTGAERKLLAKRDTDSIEAYQLYLLGRYHLARNVDEGLWLGLDYFQQAIAKDPDYAQAHAGVADAHNSLCGFNVIAPKIGFPKARAAAEKALRLDEGLVDAHIALANIALFYDWDWGAAERQFRRALELNPAHAEARRWYGYGLAVVGRFDEALREARRAVELDPLSLDKITGVGEVLFLAGRLEQAEAEHRRALEMDPNFGFGHWSLGRVLVEQGRHQQAIEAFQKAIPLSGDSPDEPAELARAYALAGERDAALEIAAQLERLAERRYVAPGVIASVYAALGERDQAFAWLERGYAERDFLLVMLEVEPMFDPLRADPRFAQLLGRVGLTP